MNNQLLNKIVDKKITVGVIGLGYVGLPLSLTIASEKINTVGFDIDEKKVQLINNGKSYINHIKNQAISNVLDKYFFATADYSDILKLDIIIICVPTPLKDNNEPDLQYIFNTLNSIKSYLRENQLLILESTTYPGTTNEHIVPIVMKLGLNIGTNFFVGYSPERVDPGNENFSIKNIPKIVSGHTKNCLKLTKSFYDQIINKTVSVSSTKVAEMTKIMENIHRAINIGLVNELKLVADKMDIDIYEVINAASTKPFGFKPYYPGPGLGGHCIPIDPFYLTWKARQIGVDTRFIELAGEINTSMPDYVIEKIRIELNEIGKTLNNCKILILGLAYKKNISDTRESPSLNIIDKLINFGAKVDYSDPYVFVFPKTRKYKIDLESIQLSAKKINSYEIVVLVTDHKLFDYDLIRKNAKKIIDTRGYYKPSNKIIRA